VTQISHSRVESALLCLRKDYYGYHLGLRRKRESDSLAMGTAGHACLDALYSTLLEHGKSAAAQRRAWKLGVAALWSKYHELVAEGYQDPAPNRWTLEECLESYARLEALVQNGWRVLAVEKEFHVRWNDEGDTINFKVDLIAANPQGKTIVVDHKFVWDYYQPRTVRLQPQLPKYIGMLRFLGYEVESGLYNMIRTRRVSGEKMLKAQIVDALDEHYNGLEVVEERTVFEKLTVPQLQEIADRIGLVTQQPPKDEQLYQTQPVEASDARVSRTLQEQFIKAEQLIELDRFAGPARRDLLSLRVANNMICKSCSFNELCATELAGDDTTLVMEEFVKRDPRELPPLDGEEDE
jgi:hypothetical protein